MSLRVAMVVERFPNETFIAQQVAGLLDRGVDVQILCQDKATDGPAVGLLAGRDMAGRVHPWPDRDRLGPRIHAGARALLGALRTSPAALMRAGRTEARRGPRGWVGRLLFDARLVALAPDVVHFQFGDLARRRVHAADAVDAAFTASFRGYDLTYTNLDDAGYYDELWPVLDGAHTLGADLLAVARRRGCPDGVPWSVIAPAVDAERFRPAIEAPTSTDGAGRALRVLSVGRLHWKKGLLDGIWAVADAAEKGLSIEYRLVGPAADTTSEALAWAIEHHGLHETVELVGPADPDEVAEHLRWADVLLHPALSEGFGNIVLEAQATGVPVVCTSAEGLAENVEADVTGIVVAVRDIEAMAHALVELADDPTRRAAMGAAGRRRAIEHFGLPQALADFERFFTSAVARRADHGTDRPGAAGRGSTGEPRPDGCVS